MRKLMLATLFAATAIFAACENKPETPNKPAVTPPPVSSPTASPTGTPAKPDASPVKKLDNTKKDPTPVMNSSPK